MAAINNATPLGVAILSWPPTLGTRRLLSRFANPRAKPPHVSTSPFHGRPIHAISDTRRALRHSLPRVSGGHPRPLQPFNSDPGY